jgi:hypothetical protein
MLIDSAQVRVFWVEILNAVVDSVVIVFLSIYHLVNHSRDGTLDTFWQSGALTYTAIIFVVSVKVSFLTATWTAAHGAILFLSVLAWFGTAFAVTNIVLVDYNWYMVRVQTLLSPVCFF